MWVVAIRKIFFLCRDIIILYTEKILQSTYYMKNAFPFIKFIVKLEYITTLRYLLV